MQWQFAFLAHIALPIHRLKIKRSRHSVSTAIARYNTEYVDYSFRVVVVAEISTRMKRYQGTRYDTKQVLIAPHPYQPVLVKMSTNQNGHPATNVE